MTPQEIEEEYRRKGFVKVVFEVEPDENAYPTAGTRERVWAIPVRGGYRLDSIPWFARFVACEDIVAVAQVDGELLFTTVLQPSGHSTIREVTNETTNAQAVRDELRAIGCESEASRVGFFAVDVPPSVDYGAVRRFLEERESQGRLHYEESCISAAHAERL